MAEKEYNDCRMNYNSDNINTVDITDIKGEHIEVSFKSLQQFVGEIFKDGLVSELNSANMADEVEFVRVMKLFTVNH